MPDFQIKISSPADLSGFTATEAAAEKVTQAVGGVTAASTSAARATGGFVDTAGKLRDAEGRFVATGKAAAEAGKSINQAATETKGLLSSIETGFGIGIGEGALHGLEAIGDKFKEVLKDGIEYNAEVQTLGIGLAATFRSVQPEKYLSFDQARQAGTETMDALREKANALGVDFRGLVESYSANVRALIDGGVNKPAQQIELVSTLVQAATSKGISGAQALRDTIDILNGRAGNIVLAKELGIEESALKAAAAAGDTYGYIMSKLGGYQEAAAASAQTYQGTLNTLKNELSQLEGEVAKPTFDKLVSLMQGGKGVLGGTQATGIAQGIGNSLGATIEGLENAVKGIEGFWERHPMLAKLNSALNTLTPEAHVGNAVKDNIDASQTLAEEQAQQKQADALKQKVADAKDDNELAKARKELEDAIAISADRVANAQGDAKDRAHNFLVVLQSILNASDRINAGGRQGDADDFASRAAAEATQDANADTKFQGSSRGIAQSAGGGEGAAAADAAEKHAAAVEKLIPALQKEDGYTAAGAKVRAEEVVSRAEVRKEIEATDKALSSLLEKEGRGASSADILPKLTGTYSSILSGLPSPARVGVSDQATDSNLDAATKAVQALPTPDGDKAAADSKAALVKLLQQAITLQKEYNEALTKEKALSDKQTEKKDQHDSTLAEQQANLAILRARAAGQDDLADKLEKEKELRQEILRLQKEGLSTQEATTLATQTQNAEQAVTDRKFATDHANSGGADSQGRYPGESGDDFFKRTGQIDARPVDTDPGGGLHTGGLTTGSLSSSTLDTSTLLKPGDSVNVGNLPTTQHVTGDVKVTNLPQPPASGGAAKDVSGGPLPLTDGSGRTFGDPGAALRDPKSAGFGDPSAALRDPSSAGFGDPSAALNVPAGTRIGNTNNGAFNPNTNNGASNPNTNNGASDGTTDTTPSPSDGGSLGSLFGGDPTLGGLFGAAPTAAAGLGPGFCIFCQWWPGHRR